MNPIVLPFPPSVNSYYRSIRMGKSCRVLISKRGREYRQAVIDLIAKLVHDDPAYQGLFPFVQRLGMTVTLNAPTRRKYDVDNMGKALLDSLGCNGARVYEDDEQIDELTLKRGDIIKGGQAIVNIYWMPEQEEEN